MKLVCTPVETGNGFYIKSVRVDKRIWGVSDLKNEGMNVFSPHYDSMSAHNNVTLTQCFFF